MSRIVPISMSLAALCAAAPASAGPAPVPSIEIGLASQGISKGLRQTEGPQLLLRPQLGFGAFYAGGQIKNIDAAADGEAAAFVGAKGKLAGLDADASLSYKFLAGVDAGATDTGAFELIASLGRKFGPVTGKLSLTASPDDLGGTRESAHIVASATAALAPGTSAGVAIGRRERAGGTDYSTFNLGVSQAVGKHLSLDLRYHDTSEGRLGEVYRGRVVASARLKF